MKEKIPLLIFGTGGISREVTFLVEDVNREEDKFDIIGFIEAKEEDIGKNVMGYEVVTSDNVLDDFVKDFKKIGMILPIGTPSIKKKIYEGLLSRLPNVVFPNIIHPNVTFDKERIKMGMGNIFTSGVRMTTEFVLGNFNLFNLNVTLGHDCLIGDYCVVNPLSSISGGVTLKGGNLVGTGVSILENITIGMNTTLGAGCVVTKNWGDDLIIVGIPGRKLK